MLEENKVKNRPRRRRNVLSWVLICLGGAGLVVAVVMLARTGREYIVAGGEYDALRAGYVTSAPAVASGGTPAPQQPATVDLAALQALNPDCVAWLELPGTGIEYPVLQAADNDYYLDHTFERTPNRAGAIFMDWRSTAAFTDGHTLVYGHNMLDGSMFSSLEGYLDPAFLEAHPALYVHLDGEVLAWQVVLARQVPGDDPLYGMVGGADGTALAEALIARLGEDLGPRTGEDRFLTLSTCTSSGDDEVRNIVVAVYTGTE
ncbi:class B sortase [Ruminococcaceae bacterium OttesenSCG-928-A11]|nr:class B sortase [Ruminococcaceae bacterium OttesenSCG-928-A11]